MAYLDRGQTLPFYLTSVTQRYLFKWEGFRVVMGGIKVVDVIIKKRLKVHVIPCWSSRERKRAFSYVAVTGMRGQIRCGFQVFSSLTVYLYMTWCLITGYTSVVKETNLLHLLPSLSCHLHCRDWAHFEGVFWCATLKHHRARLVFPSQSILVQTDIPQLKHWSGGSNSAMGINRRRCRSCVLYSDLGHAKPCHKTYFLSILLVQLMHNDVNRLEILLSKTWYFRLIGILL